MRSPCTQSSRWSGQLRTVWLRSLDRPDKAIAAVVEFNARLWQSAVDTWNEAGQHWLGLTQSDVPVTPRMGTDKRFAAPEWRKPRLPHAQGALPSRFGVVASTDDRSG
jgi:hypothetical protein